MTGEDLQSLRGARRRSRSTASAGAGRPSRPLARARAHVRRVDAQPARGTSRRPHSGPREPRGPRPARRAVRDSRRPPLRRAAVCEGDPVAAAVEGRVPRVRSRQGAGALVHTDSGSAHLLPRPEGAARAPHLLRRRPDHGGEPLAVDAARHRPLPRADGVRGTGAHAPVRRRLVRPGAVPRGLGQPGGRGLTPPTARTRQPGERGLTPPTARTRQPGERGLTPPIARTRQPGERGLTPPTARLRKTETRGGQTPKDTSRTRSCPGPAPPPYSAGSCRSSACPSVCR